jgi:16S rRNA (guanine527-N7)-methyltransferase
MSDELLEQNVSRETYDKLRAYEALIRKWNPSINLVAKSTLSDVWNRHIIDSAQVYAAASGEKSSIWTDMGSGGGLPGIVIATLTQGEDQQTNVTMVESEKRKSVFLRTAIRELGLSNAEVINERIEGAQISISDIVSARALAPLTDLFTLSQGFADQNTTFLFQKGKNWASEIEVAQNHWSFEYDAIKSETDSNAVILKIRGLSRV